MSPRIEDEWRERIVEEIRDALSGSYNEDGIAAWFSRPRTQFGGKTASEVLMAAETEDEPAVLKVRRLALELRG